MKHRLGDVAALLGGALCADAELAVEHFATDSREVRPGSLFLAIRGANVDGHDFAAQAMQRGAVAVVAERPIPEPHILVDRIEDALARMALGFRRTFQGPVIAVTGSVGKTTAKELIAQALSPLGEVLKTQGNRNTEYTAPLLWAELVPETKAVVVEMGMRGFGQIAHLASFSQPEIGLITNIGPSHLELVGSLEGVARAKGELFQALPESGYAVLPWEEPFRSTLAAMTEAKVRTFGWDSAADCWIQSYETSDFETRVKGECLGEPFEAWYGMLGRHLAASVAGALLVAVLAGGDLEEATAALRDIVMPGFRMKVVHRGEQLWLLDMYNAAPASLLAAFDVAHDVQKGRPLVLTLGEMRELGEATESAHRHAGKAAARLKPHRLLLLDAPNSTLHPTKFVAEAAIGEGLPASQVVRCSSLSEMQSLLSQIPENAVVLVKGSRAVELERALPEGVLV